MPFAHLHFVLLVPGAWQCCELGAPCVVEQAVPVWLHSKAGARGQHCRPS